MRTLFYIILFITPTVLVIVFRQDIQNYLVEQGILSPDMAEGPPAGAGGGADPDLGAPEGAPTESERPSGASSGEVAGGNTKGLPSEKDIDREIAAQYPLPVFKSLESIVENWKNVPENAFPKVVTLKKPVDLELIINGKVSGKSTLRVGQQAYPVVLDGETLTVSGAPGDVTMKGAVPVDETNFKDQIRKTYEAWKTGQEGRVRKLRKEEKQRRLAKAKEAAEPSENSAAAGALLGEEPSVNPDGSVPVMLQSIRSGQVKEIQLGAIDYWRWNGYEEIGGVGYWTGVVGYTAETMFGEINAEGKALIQNGRVVKWIYSGSEEEIR